VGAGQSLWGRPTPANLSRDAVRSRAPDASDGNGDDPGAREASRCLVDLSILRHTGPREASQKRDGIISFLGRDCRRRLSKILLIHCASPSLSLSLLHRTTAAALQSPFLLAHQAYPLPLLVQLCFKLRQFAKLLALLSHREPISIGLYCRLRLQCLTGHRRFLSPSCLGVCSHFISRVGASRPSCL
jgi:hypothetical protein